MKKLSIKNVHQFALPLFKWNKENNNNLKYADCVAYAFNLFNTGKIEELKALTSITVTMESKQVEKAKTVQTEKESKKREKKQVKRIITNEDEKVADIEFAPIKLSFFTDVENDNLNKIIAETVENWNKLKGIHKTERTIFFNEIMFGDNNKYKGLVNAQNIKEVQTAIIMLLDRRVKSMIYKMLEFGANVKKKEQKTNEELQNMFSYQVAPSNNGKITAYDVEDIYNELIIHSYEKTFNNDMFTEYAYIFTSLYMRISNILRKEIRRNAKFKASIGHDAVMVIADNQLVFDTPFNDIVELASTVISLTDNEKALLKLRLQGYDKKEINDLTNKRNDRTFNSYEKKLSEKANMTMKEAKAIVKLETENNKKRMQQMKERLEIEALAEKTVLELNNKKGVEAEKTVFTPQYAKGSFNELKTELKESKATTQIEAPKEKKAIERKLSSIDAKINKAKREDNKKLVEELIALEKELYAQYKAM